MVDIKYVLDRIRDVKLKDYLSVFPMTAALLLRPFFKKKFEGAWLVCEEPAEARDNGYHFFQYMCERQSGQKCLYAIKRKSVDSRKVMGLGEVIEYGSILHWLAYFLCEYNISSQKGGKPNAAVCSFMELSGKFHTKNVFLQHGITINSVKFLYADRSCIEKFITSAEKETEYIKQNFGYPAGTIELTGMPRFDALHNTKAVSNRVLIMPTWRYWFDLKSKQHSDINSDFATSEYLNRWIEILEHPEMEKIIKEYKLDVIFYLHRNMQKHVEVFRKTRLCVTIASWKKYDIQGLLKSSEMMIKDYSSVFFDMVYMKRPVIFYQFDGDTYRKYQYQEGWFDYSNNAFGNSFSECEDVINEMEKIVKSGFIPSERFLEEHQKMFSYYDNLNSERVYKMLKGKTF